MGGGENGWRERDSDRQIDKQRERERDSDRQIDKQREREIQTDR